LLRRVTSADQRLGPAPCDLLARGEELLSTFRFRAMLSGSVTDHARWFGLPLARVEAASYPRLHSP
jgi:hypothetical protein